MYRPIHTLTAAGFVAAAMLAEGSFAGAQTQASQPAAMAASPALATNLDKLKCTDIGNSQKLVHDEIMKRIREAKSKGLSPAISYEGDGRLPSLAQRVEARANQTASRLSSALFAAVGDPQNAADAASTALTGQSNRRTSLDVFVRCSSQDLAPRTIIKNESYFVQKGNACRNGDKPDDVGLNSSQVFQTSLPPDQVITRFVRAKLMSSDGDKVSNEVTVCNGSPALCRDSHSYEPVNPSYYQLKQDKDMYFKDETEFSASPLGFKITDPRHMVNLTSWKLSSIDVCGAKVYLVTGFANGNNDGFDRSTMIGLVASIGGKTVVLGDFSAQSMSQDSWPTQLATSYQTGLMSGIFGSVDQSSGKLSGGYISVAEMIGSRERPAMGLIGGIPEFRFLPGGPSSAGSSRAGRASN